MIASSDDATMAASNSRGGGGAGKNVIAGTSPRRRSGLLTVKPLPAPRSTFARDLGAFFPGLGEPDRNRLLATLDSPAATAAARAQCTAFATPHRALDSTAGGASVSCHHDLRWLGVIRDGRDTTLSRAMGATVERPIRLNPMAQNLAAAVIAGRSELMNCTFETVECVARAIADDVECEVILVTANFTFCHTLETPRRARSSCELGLTRTN
jgi:hypothetical protein